MFGQTIACVKFGQEDFTLACLIASYIFYSFDFLLYDFGHSDDTIVH